MKKGFVVGFVLALVAACATVKNDQTVCAEYRGLRCLAGVTCTADKARGCKVCRCDDAMGGQGPDGNPTVNKPAIDQR